MTPNRLSWDQYFMEICRVVAQRSTCPRAAVGAVIVLDRTILATGYNGAPAGLSHCTEVGCLVTSSITPDGSTEENCFRTIHAEINAIAQAAKHGVSIGGSSIYITHSPLIAPGFFDDGGEVRNLDPNGPRGLMSPSTALLKCPMTGFLGPLQREIHCEGETASRRFVREGPIWLGLNAGMVLDLVRSEADR